MWLISLFSQSVKIGQTAAWGSVCIFPGVCSLKRKINISADDFVIVKHTHEVAGCVCAWAWECSHASQGAASWICMSGVNIYHHHQDAAKQQWREGGCAAALRRDCALSILFSSNIKTFPKCFWGEGAFWRCIDHRFLLQCSIFPSFPVSLHLFNRESWTYL